MDTLTYDSSVLTDKVDRLEKLQKQDASVILDLQRQVAALQSQQVTSWQTISPGNNWVVGASYAPKYRIFNNTVYLQGVVRLATANIANIGSVIFTMPAGYRPGVNMLFTTPGFGDGTNYPYRMWGDLVVAGSGAVSILAVQNTLTWPGAPPAAKDPGYNDIYLDGVAFIKEQ